MRTAVSAEKTATIAISTGVIIVFFSTAAPGSLKPWSDTTPTSAVASAMAARPMGEGEYPRTDGRSKDARPDTTDKAAIIPPLLV
ncbi:hypothetical protein AC482_05640 [miscellaneous Crenarchaeota group-15 archaeon DG-45]|uniref:Uncharacterized protein n=1 Tax=miscellaneous Crenarchaeota group-15 archaeon DG-45 TaxID=1685127 RepID=A0A0M0BME3_9ARCH|nr:MAG: hypothetical protein AC482_05640 [miscellaneous Crenarchaeota group-15 archaeon DG-45]